MARRARLVIPGIPHYIQQSGWEDGHVFFDRGDAKTYRAILQRQSAAAGLQILAYCFMPNDIQILAVPLLPTSLRKAIGETNRQYARHIAATDKCDREQLWAERFHSFPLQEKYTQHILHVIEWTPVLSGEVRHPRQWHYASARPRIQGGGDPLITDHPVLETIQWDKINDRKPSYLQMDLIASHQSTGRPLGDQDFITWLEKKLGRRLRPRKRGRRPNAPSLKTRMQEAARS